MRLHGLIVSISFIGFYIFYSATPASAEDAPLTPCDTYAASPFDPQRQTTGVSIVNTPLAIPACQSAIQTYPTSPRLNFQLGRAYYAAKNFREGSAFFLRAAEQGYAAAETALGDAFQSGTGVSQSYTDAITWYTKAAKQGFAIAQNSLGAMYEQGLGGPRDIIAALAWYRKAAKQGDSAAQANLTRLDTNAFANTKLEPASQSASTAKPSTKSLPSPARTMIVDLKSADGKADAQARGWTAATTRTLLSQHYGEFLTVKAWLRSSLVVWLAASFILVFLALTKKVPVVQKRIHFFLSSIVFTPPLILALL